MLIPLRSRIAGKWGRLLLLLVFAFPPTSHSLLSSDNFIVRYDSVDVALAREVVERAEVSLAQVAAQLEYPLDEKILIVITSTEARFRETVQGEVPEWGLAFAFSEESKIVLKSPRLLKKAIDVDVVLTHEVSHVMLYRVLKGHRAPLWLNEGFAMYQSREWKLENSAVVGWAAVTDRLYDLDELEVVFPWSGEGARLAYAESFLAISYIIQQFGKESLISLIRDLGDGFDIDMAMRRRFGIGYKRFKRDWMTYTEERFSVLAFMVSPATVWSLVIVLAVIVYVRKRRSRSRMIDDDLDYDVDANETWSDHQDDM